MTGTDPRLEERVLTFLGAFSSLQAAIDTVWRLFMQSRMPDLGPAISKTYLKRLSDEDRIHFFLETAKDARYSGDLTHARAIFNRAYATRDLVSHSESVTLASVLGEPRPRVFIARDPSFSAAKLNKVPAKVYPETFERLRTDCAWLAAHAWRLAHDAGLIRGLDMAGNPVVPPMPPARPVGGEPLTWQGERPAEG